jgi:hypothetical protein
VRKLTAGIGHGAHLIGLLYWTRFLDNDAIGLLGIDLH